METGIKAWLANQEPGAAAVELPGGWRWDMQADRTGYLMSPDGQRCVGFDVDKNMIQFGADGQTKAPGLNLWTIQEMGEKFARENFMDEAAGREYDQFAAARREQRSAYEKGVRSEMTGMIQVELYEGEWKAHVDSEAVAKFSGISCRDEMTRQEGIALFNRMSEAKNVMPLRDPMGYMTLDGNLYNYIKEQYEFQYEDMIDNIDAGFINGNGRGCEAVLDKLDATVRKNIREYCLPDGVNYQDLRHMEATEELCEKVDAFVKQRVTKTVNFEKKRSHSPESLAKDHEKFVAAAVDLQNAVAESALKPMDVSMENTDDIKI